MQNEPFCFKTDCRWKETIHFLLACCNYESTNYSESLTSRVKKDDNRNIKAVAHLLWQIFRIPNHSIFVLRLLFSNLIVENKTKHTHAHTKKKTQEKTTPNLHTVKIAECLLLFHSQFDGENMYMSMTEPSQDYVPASQVG